MNAKKMKLSIINMRNSDRVLWDDYVRRHPGSNVYHQSAWKQVIEKAYHHKGYYLMAVMGGDANDSKPGDNRKEDEDQLVVKGILPLFSIRHRVLGNKLVSMPFFDTGGILADDEWIETELIREALSLAERTKTKQLSLRHSKPLKCAPEETGSTNLNGSKGQSFHSRLQQHKVRMLLTLEKTAESMMGSFKSKLRSQIRKPIKEKLTVKNGRMELLEDFYTVFAINMRDLGSPVHSKRLIQKTLQHFEKWARVFVVYKDRNPVAGSITLRHKDTLGNPWASALREYSHLSPNMLLYWSMLEYGCSIGCTYFDFGRSTPDEGTYRFKSQWGAIPEPLYWYDVSRERFSNDASKSEKDRLKWAIDYWKKMPVPLSRFIGPRIRKYITL
jgi:FemAB-related protein (PEP-CTERM system-associated)